MLQHPTDGLRAGQSGRLVAGIQHPASNAHTGGIATRPHTLSSQAIEVKTNGKSVPLATSDVREVRTRFEAGSRVAAGCWLLRSLTHSRDLLQQCAGKQLARCAEFSWERQRKDPLSHALTRNAGPSRSKSAAGSEATDRPPQVFLHCRRRSWVRSKTLSHLLLVALRHSLPSETLSNLLRHLQPARLSPAPSFQAPGSSSTKADHTLNTHRRQPTAQRLRTTSFLSSSGISAMR